MSDMSDTCVTCVSGVIHSSQIDLLRQVCIHKTNKSIYVPEILRAQNVFKKGKNFSIELASKCNLLMMKVFMGDTCVLVISDIQQENFMYASACVCICLSCQTFNKKISCVCLCTSGSFSKRIFLPNDVYVTLHYRVIIPVNFSTFCYTVLCR